MKAHFFGTLWSVASIYGQIFSGLANPPKEPRYLSTSDEAVINALKQDKLAIKPQDDLSNPREIGDIMIKDFNEKQEELGSENNSRQSLYERNEMNWEMAITRARLFLHKFIGGFPKNSIYRVQDPRECYLLLEAHYSKPSTHCTVFRMKKWSEIRYKGSNPVRHVTRFKEAKINWEEWGEKASPFLEMYLFLISIMTMPDYAAFMQNLVFSDMQTLYKGFIQWELAKRF
ncbi:hypothetical protein N7541_002794 [Penicillium brevicompactum]|uniref:Uncharacterized protein n=1 Tax=Penicillium brevicompactum TaxID=5074 RepID=A0A9W9RLX0_PENBR|nr:hypothetical protein N7541_002794 [Penicillium brevicompactum]